MSLVCGVSRLGRRGALRLANASSLQQRAACRGSLTSTQQPHSARRRTTPASSLRTLAAIWTRCWSCRSCIATGQTFQSSSSMASWSAFGLATIPPSGRGARWSRSARGCRASAKPICVCPRRRSAFWLTLARLDSCLQHTQFQGHKPGRLIPRLPASIPGVGARWRRIHLRPRVQGVSGPSCGGCRHSACGACSPATRRQAHITIRDAGTGVKMDPGRLSYPPPRPAGMRRTNHAAPPVLLDAAMMKWTRCRRRRRAGGVTIVVL